MRISDWSSDVCSSDLGGFDVFLAVLDFLMAFEAVFSSCSLRTVPRTPFINLLELSPPKALANSTASLITTFGGAIWLDRKRVVSGKSVSVRVDLGGRRVIKKKKEKTLVTIKQE